MSIQSNPPIHPLIAPHRDIHLRRRFLNYRFLIVKSPLKHPSDWGNHLKYERTFSFWIWRIQLFQKFSYLKLSTFQVFVFKLFTFRALHPVLLLHYLALYSHLTTTTNRQNGPPSETFYMQNTGSFRKNGKTNLFVKITISTQIKFSQLFQVQN